MTTRQLSTALTIGALVFGCAQGEDLPKSQTAGGTTSASGGSTMAENGGTTPVGSTNPSSGGGGATATGATAAKGGTTGLSTTGASTGGKTATATTAATADCGTLSGDVTVTHTPRSATETGGTTKVTPAAGKTINAADVQIEYCFSVIGPVTLGTASGTRVDSGGMTTSVAPYYTNIGTVASSVKAATTGYCLVFDFAAVAGVAGVKLTGTDNMSIAWVFEPSGALGGGAIIDPRATPQIVVSVAGVAAACAAAS